MDHSLSIKASTVLLAFRIIIHTQRILVYASVTTLFNIIPSRRKSNIRVRIFLLDMIIGRVVKERTLLSGGGRKWLSQRVIW